MRLDTTITRYHWSGSEPVGTLVWDSETGELGGTFADKVREAASEAKRAGVVYMIGPVPSVWDVQVKDPLHRPREFAALLQSMGVFVPAELQPVLPKMPRGLRKYNPNVVY